MFRCLLRTGHIARTTSLGVCERGLILSKCNKSALFRLSNRGGLQPLSTCSVRLCEKKDHAVLPNNDDKTQGDKKVESAESLPVAAEKVEDVQKDHVVLSGQNENINTDKKEDFAESLTVAAQKVEDVQKDHVVLSDQNENINTDKKDELSESLPVAAQKSEDENTDHVVLSDHDLKTSADKKDESAESLTVAAQKVEEENLDHAVLSDHDTKINADKDESAESLTLAAQKVEEENLDHVVLSDQDAKINADKDESAESLTVASQKVEEENLDHVVVSDHDTKINVDKDESAESLTVAPQKVEEENVDHLVLSDHDEKINLDKKDESIETAKGEDEVLIVAELKEEPVVLKTDDGGSTQQQQVDVEMEQNVSSPEQAQPKAPTSVKESLLELLSGMKVDITSKRKKKISKAHQNQEHTPKSQPVAMESTISMFEEAMKEAPTEAPTEVPTEAPTVAMVEATTEASLQGETLDPQLVSAASAAAATLPNENQAMSKLLKQLREQESITKAQSTGHENDLGALIADMKVRKRSKRQSPRPNNSIAFDEDGSGFKKDRGITAELSDIRRRLLYRGKGLGIFAPSTDEARVESAFARPTLWDMDFALKLSESVNQRPQNGLEEMIQWTKEGKMWVYPVNNEAGMDEEAEVQFHEHIFLEEHLKEGFPQKGPVRHFMELVVAGLSKNPYLTVQQKREHISWFRDYFHQKEDILRETGVPLK